MNENTCTLTVHTQCNLNIKNEKNKKNKKTPKENATQQTDWGTSSFHRDDEECVLMKFLIELAKPITTK